MDLATLQARAQAAREFEHTIGDVTYRLRVPTRTEVLTAAQRSGAMRTQGDAAGYLLLQRATTEIAVIGWTGLRVRHLLPQDPDGNTPLAWEEGAVPLVLDAQPDHADELGEVIGQRLKARTATIEADAKN